MLVRLYLGILSACVLSAGPLCGAAASGTQVSPTKISVFGVYEGYSPEAFPDQVQSSFYLPMRDGVRLAVDLYRPAINGKAAEGRFPVVWHHTFDRHYVAAAARSAASAAPELTKFGYVVAIVERRGMGASFGERRGYNDRIEAEDAYEVTEWLARQPWSNGQVGIVGCSNTGAAAMHAITIRPPHLLAAFVGCFAWDTYDWTLRGGIFAQWGTGVQRTVEEDLKSKPVDGDESKVLLLQAAQEHLKSTNLAAMWRGIPYRDDFSPLTASRFWSEGSIASYADEMRQSGVTLYITGGWRDDLRKDGWVTFNNWTPGKRHIVIGPWTHCRNDGFDLFAEMHRFFDFYLKDIDNGFSSDAPIHFFTVNAPAGREWQTSQVWPPAGGQEMRLHLADKSRLSETAGNGGTTFQVRYDISCASGFDAALQSGPNAQPCPVEQAGAHFYSSVMKADTEVTGHPIADLWISADAVDVNLFVYLEDVAPDGTVTAITDARQRASLRKVATPPYNDIGLPWRRSNREDVQPLIPGSPVRVQMDLFPVSYLFKQGHRIRVSVTGADYRERDRQAVNPAPKVTIYDSKSNPSLIVLPARKANS
jgi:putative CocE/NonD family hydrolase